MRTTLSSILFTTLIACGSNHESGTNIDLADLEATEGTSIRANSASDDDPPPSEEEDKPDDGAFASLTGTGDISSGFEDTNVYGGLLGEGAMTLEEGKMGKHDPALARRQAIESARTAGILGTGTFGTIGNGGGTGTGYGYGRSGYGPSGGGVGPNSVTDTEIYGGKLEIAGARGGIRGKTAADPTTADQFKDYGKNAWTIASIDRVSTFAVDVDTASYTLARRSLNEGRLPPPASVRVEEMVNYFKYSYINPAPDTGRPFAVAMDMAPSPFASDRQILRVGVSSKPLSIAERKQANLVFLVDVSGSMQSDDKLPLALRSLRILVDNLKDGDTVALVTYAGSTRVVLPPTGLEHKAKILSAIEDLRASGSTAMGDGIALAYAQAAKGLRPDAISRVIVLSDGDANVGKTSHDEILATITGKVKEGVTLSTIGFGMGNYKDELMEQLANKGNGNNYYIDGLGQARRVFQEQLGGTLEVIAKDVKIQVDFDPDKVTRYRLIGYENRNIADQDFRNDKVDAGEIGAGHQVTAVYEVELANNVTGGVATVRVRHKQPRGTTATEAAYPMTARAASFDAASSDFRFAFAVAAFADVLRGADDAKGWDLAAIRSIVVPLVGASADRAEFLRLVDKAIALRGKPVKTT